MEIAPEQLKEWIALLGKPTAGLVAFIILILYRDTVSHIIKKIADIFASWFIKK